MEKVLGDDDEDRSKRRDGAALTLFFVAAFTTFKKVFNAGFVKSDDQKSKYCVRCAGRKDGKEPYVFWACATMCPAEKVAV
jgi:hypothetical protein